MKIIKITIPVSTLISISVLNLEVAPTVSINNLTDTNSWSDKSIDEDYAELRFIHFT